jgi:hypothetical protein
MKMIQLLIKQGNKRKKEKKKKRKKENQKERKDLRETNVVKIN